MRMTIPSDVPRVRCWTPCDLQPASVMCFVMLMQWARTGATKIGSVSCATLDQLSQPRAMARNRANKTATAPGMMSDVSEGA